MAVFDILCSLTTGGEVIGNVYRLMRAALAEAAAGDLVVIGEYELFLAYVQEQGGTDRPSIEQAIRSWRPRRALSLAEDLSEEFADIADLLAEVCDGVELDEVEIPDPRPIAFGALWAHWVEHPFLPCARPVALLTDRRASLLLTGPR